jgi:hypothetical protein
LLDEVDIPIVPIGLGLQSNHTNVENVGISPSCERLARQLSRKAHQISVRGDFTKAYLNGLGLDNVVTTGCPSIYMRLTETPGYDPDGGLTILSTRFPMTRAFLASETLNRNLFGFAARQGLDILFQSEIEEMRYLFAEDKEALFPANFPTGLQELYGFDTPDALVSYLSTQGRSFDVLDEWVAYVQGKAGMIGTRLHGTILSLNAGCPAILIAHDSRTSEMIQFANLPTAQLPADISGMTTQDFAAMLKPDDIARYAETRGLNSQIYKGFLKDSGLHYKESAMF